MPREPLSPDDAAILALESSAIAGHTLKLVLLAPGERPLGVDALRASVASRLAAEPRAMQRIEDAEGSPYTAAWVEDEGFDLAAHVRERGGTAGIDEPGLWAVAGELMSERLDHARPLWAFDLVGPLADGRDAIVVRIHHAMADGIGCVRLLDALLWDERESSGASSAGAAHADLQRSVELRRLPGAVARELGARLPASPFDRPLGVRRALAFASAPLEMLKRVGASRPGHATVNDVLLAGVAGGLREWLAATGRRLPRLRAQVPVSLHHRDASAGVAGNRDSFLNVDLPLAEPDPLARLDRIREETEARKRLGDADELYDLFHALGRFRHAGRAVERLAASPREFSLSVSNVPGPRAPVTVLDRPVESFFSVAEPADRHVLRVAAISCAGVVGIGLCTDPDALEGIDELGAAIDASFEDLSVAAGSSPSPPGTG
jgi:hypothetical protein